MKFDVNQIKESAKSAGAVATGLIAGNAVKKLLMTGKDNKEPMIPDTATTNIVACAGALVGSTFIKDSFAKVALGALGAFFLIRTVNKASSDLSGLGADGEPTAVSKALKSVNEWLPQLGAPDENAGNNDFSQIVNRAALPPSYGPASVSDGNPALVGIGQGSSVTLV